MTSETTDACPICLGPLLATPTENREHAITRLNCSNCGDHRFTSGALRQMQTVELDPAEQHKRARIAHGIVRLPTGTLVRTYLLNDLDKATQLPDALERIDLLVRLLATSVTPGHTFELKAPSCIARLGCESRESTDWVVDQAQRAGYVDGPETTETRYLTLTAQGWERYAALLRAGVGSRHAFMAMKFGDAEMDRVFGDFMRPAVAQTGFDLRTTVGDHQTAGSIDNRMRVEIRTSRFVLCDLTHGNQGAYWEAGFAEGLGRPVIYTCRRDVLETPKAVHFDTAHQLIIKWDLSNMDEAMQELKATIRATLPAEARLTD